MLAQATEALRGGRMLDAERIVQALQASIPHDPRLWHLQAALLQARGRWQASVALLRRAASARADDVAIHNALGVGLRAMGEPAEALVAFQRARDLKPDVPTFWCNCGGTLVALARPREAMAQFQQALTLAPDYLQARLGLGLMHAALGDIDQAEATFRQTLKIQPRAAAAWWELANLKTVRFGDEDLHALEALHDDVSLSVQDRILVGFTLGRALQQHAAYARAMNVFGQANARQKSMQRWDAAGFAAHVRDIGKAFAEPAAGSPAEQGGEVIFLVGLPRSGSTLSEQILAAHPQVAGAGELADLQAVLDGYSQNCGQTYPDWVEAATPRDWQRMGEQYLERTLRWRQQRPRFTDKMTHNWLSVGAALAMLPAARVLICRRDPVENLFSCYRQWFPEGKAWSYDFDDLAACWHAFDQLASHWADIHPRRVRVQSYEDLVADPDAQIRALLEFCGLPFDETCLRFHEVERDVLTVSAAQVRQPLRRDTAMADRYGTLLDPLRHALATARSGPSDDSGSSR